MAQADDEDGDVFDDIASDDDSNESRSQSSNSDIDGIEDEWTQTNRKKKDATGVYFLGTQPVVEEIEPSSELVRRSMDIARRASIHLNKERAQRLSIHESLEASAESSRSRTGGADEGFGAINASIASSHDYMMMSGRQSNSDGRHNSRGSYSNDGIGRSHSIEVDDPFEDHKQETRGERKDSLASIDSGRDGLKVGRLDELDDLGSADDNDVLRTPSEGSERLLGDVPRQEEFDNEYEAAMR